MNSAETGRLTVNESVKPGGYAVELYNDHIFSELRAYAQVPDEFCNVGWSFDSLVNGGGKGGTLMAEVGHSYIVKELGKGDHSTLLKLASSYGAHVRNGGTLLCPIYLHFRDRSSGRSFFAMRNCIGEGPFIALYDLKGCDDDKTIEEDGEKIKAVHKRVWNVGMWCNKSSWSSDRVKYFDGKQAARKLEIELLDEQRKQVLECIRRDTEWLKSHGLMDYSLLVAIKDVGDCKASGLSSPSTLQHAFVRRSPEGRDLALYINVIDFLQRWTNAKRAARILKALEPNKATVPPGYYADRFRRHFESRIKVAPRAPAPTAPVPGAMRAVAPIGDCESEGVPENRVHSRASRSESRGADEEPRAGKMAVRQVAEQGQL